MLKPNCVCKQCGQFFHCKPSHLKNGRKYCSSVCSWSSLKKGKVVSCFICKANFYRNAAEIKKSKSGKLFCSHTCSAKWSNTLENRKGERHSNWLGGHSSYRTRAIEKYGLKCKNGESCPLKDVILPKFLLEVDHIDGNKKNSKISNLQILCVWCHQIKTFNNKNYKKRTKNI